MIVNKKSIRDIIERLHNHYNLFFSNQYIKYYLLDSKIPRNVWVNIEDLMNSVKEYQDTGHELEKLYEQILSYTSFMQTIKNEILPRMLKEAQQRMHSLSTDNRILFKMTLNNTPGNLEIFHNLTTELFIAVRDADISKYGEEKALYKRLPYTKDIENILEIR
jgi:hypothetical protein